MSRMNVAKRSRRRFQVDERRAVCRRVDGELWRTGQGPIGFPTLRLRLLASKTLQSIQLGKTTRVEVANSLGPGAVDL